MYWILASYSGNKYINGKLNWTNAKGVELAIQFLNILQGVFTGLLFATHLLMGCNTIHERTKLCQFFSLKYKLFINSDWWVILGSKDYFMSQLIDAFWNQINCTSAEMKNNPSTTAHNLSQMTLQKVLALENMKMWKLA